MKKKATNQEKEIFLYLNRLRVSGITNMFGAAPYIVEMFEVSKPEARKFLGLWMKNFNDEGNYDEIEVS